MLRTGAAERPRGGRGEIMYPDALFGSVTLYDICNMLAVLAALIVARVYADKLKISAKLQNCGILTAGFSILAGYGFATLFQSFYNYLEDPAGGFVWKGMTFYGGLIGGAAIFLLVWFTLIRKLCGRAVIDIFPQVCGIAACCIAAAHCIGRIGCFMAGCCHGAETDSFFGIYEPGAFKGAGGRVYPTQLFEAVFLLELFLLFTYLLFRTRRGSGLTLYMILYGAFRFVIEFLRADDRGSFLGSLTPSQTWSLVLIAAGIAVFAAEKLLRKKRAA